MNKANYRFPQYQPKVPCTTVGTHFNPHDEEGFSMSALFYYGDKVHPGITDAIEEGNFIFVDAGATTYQGKDWRQWHKEGVVFVGTMGSPYDEHFLPEGVKETECSATLVARALDLQGREFQCILDALIESDRKSEKNIISFSSHLSRYAKMLNSYDQETQTKILRYAMDPFNVYLELQERFTHATSYECKKKATTRGIKHRGNPIRVSFIESDDPQMASVMKTAFGERAHVAIVKNSRGHVYLSTTRRPNINLDRVYTELLFAEAKERNLLTKKVASFIHRRVPTETPLEEIWHFQKEAGRIFNGAYSAPDKPATKLSSERIMEIVLKTLQQENPATKLGANPGFSKLYQMQLDGKHQSKKVI